MTSHTTVNVDLLIAKLLLEIKHAQKGNFTTCKVALLEMAVRAIEQQKAQIAALERNRMQHIGLAVAVEAKNDD